MPVFYNEIDPFAAAWLRELITRGIIAPGVVDERSIEDIRPDELSGFTQCHIFAGIGVWSYALRCAGWPDDRPVWTGSCPCQPFSAAGKRGGTADERHLWPAFFHLISQCKPVVVFGEQVASKDGLAWLDTVHADLEGEGYAVGASDMCAAGFGAPHIRQRLWFVAESVGDGRGRSATGKVETRPPDGRDKEVSRANKRRELSEGFERPSDEPDYVAESVCVGRRGRGDGDTPGNGGEVQVDGRGGVGSVAFPAGEQEHAPATSRLHAESGERGDVGYSGGEGREGDRSELLQGEIQQQPAKPGPTNGFWRDAEWLPCTDGKARPTGRGINPLVGKLAYTAGKGGQSIRGREKEQGQAPVDVDARGGIDGHGPVEPGAFPLVDGAAKGLVRSGDCGEEVNANNTAEARVMRLRGYGNAIVAPVAEAWIRAYMELREEEEK